MRKRILTDMKFNLYMTKKKLLLINRTFLVGERKINEIFIIYQPKKDKIRIFKVITLNFKEQTTNFIVYQI